MDGPDNQVPAHGELNDHCSGGSEVRDIKCYVCGEEPSPSAAARATRPCVAK